MVLHIHRRLIGFIAAVGFLSLLLGTSGHGANLVVNGEFAGGVTGWQTVGTVFDTGQTAVLSDQGGTRVVLFQTAAVSLGMTTSLSLRYDLFVALSAVAGLGQTPDSLFLTAFLGTVPFGNSFAAGLHDEAVPVLDVDYRGPANGNPGLTSGPSPKGAGWTRYHLAIPVTGYVTVAFEFIDGNGIAGDSTVAVDNVALDAVLIPEPSAAALLIGTGALALRRKLRMDDNRNNFL